MPSRGVLPETGSEDGTSWTCSLGRDPRDGKAFAAARGQRIAVKVILTEHARTVLAQRGIEPKWVQSTVDNPQRVETRPDGTSHFLAVIPQREGHVLRVVVKARTRPRKVITAFFDRRLKGEAL